MMRLMFRIPVLSAQTGELTTVSESLWTDRRVVPTEIEEKTRTRGNEIVAAKGGTNFGIASTVAGIVQTILWDERRIVPVSTLLDGEYGEHDVFLGVPTELRANGANEIVELDLSEDERAKLHHSAELVREHCEGLL